MTASSPMEEELDILVARYLDGTASEDEVSALERRLRADPRSARAVFEAAYYDELLRDALAGAAVTASSADAASDGKRTMRLAPALGADGGAGAAGWGQMHGRENVLRLPSSSHWAGLSALAACILLSLAVFWQVGIRLQGGPDRAASKGGEPGVAPPPVPHLIESGAGVRIEHGPSGAWEPAGSDVALGIADRVVTGRGAAVVAFERRATRLTLGPDTTLARTAGAAGMRWDLASGSLRSEVERPASPPQTDRPPLVVTTPNARVEAAGSGAGRDVFDVSVQGGVTRIQTLEGTVRVSRRTDGATVEVGAGQYVDVGTPTKALGAPAGGRDVGNAWVVTPHPAPHVEE